MTTYRIRHSRDYFCLSRHAAQDVSISLRARGLHHLLLSFPDDWEINEKHIVKMAGIEKREAVRKAMKELMDAGYVVRSQSRSSGKFSRAAYDIFEVPQPTVAQESDHGKTGDGGIGSGKTGDGNPDDILSIDPQSIDQDKVLTSTTTTERPKKKAGSSSAGEKVDASLLDSNAQEVADYLATWGYPGNDGETYPYRKTKALLNACEGHTLDSAYKALLAAAEFMSVKRHGGELIRSAEAVLVRALQDSAEPSAEFEAKQKAAQQQQDQAKRREAQTDYNLRWLHAAVDTDLLEITEYDAETQNYSFRYPGETMVRNCNLWDLPPKYAHLTIEELSRVEVAA